MFEWMFALVPLYNFIIHNICMKTLDVYFHAVQTYNVFIKKKDI